MPSNEALPLHTQKRRQEQLSEKATKDGSLLTDLLRSITQTTYHIMDRHHRTKWGREVLHFRTSKPYEPQPITHQTYTIHAFITQSGTTSPYNRLYNNNTNELFPILVTILTRIISFYYIRNSCGHGRKTRF